MRKTHLTRRKNKKKMMILQLKRKFFPQYATGSGQGHELFHLPADDAVLDLIGGPRPEVEAVHPLRGTFPHRHSRISLHTRYPEAPDFLVERKCKIDIKKARQGIISHILKFSLRGPYSLLKSYFHLGSQNINFAPLLTGSISKISYHDTNLPIRK
jgi:hypothetical protein